MVTAALKVVVSASFVPVFVSVTGTNERRPPQTVAQQQLATGVKAYSGEDRIQISPHRNVLKANDLQP